LKEIQWLSPEARLDRNLKTYHAYPLSGLLWTALPATAEQFVQILAQRLQICREMMELTTKVTMRTEWVRQDIAWLEFQFQWTFRPAMAEVHFVHVYILAWKKSSSFR